MGLRRQGYLAALSLCGTCWAPSPFSLPQPVLRPKSPGPPLGLGEFGQGWQGVASDPSWVLPAPPPSSTSPLMLESSCQGLSTINTARPWGRSCGTAFGKRSMVSPCLAQVNAISSESQK